MTRWFKLAILVEIPAERPARPAPMMIRCIDSDMMILSLTASRSDLIPVSL